MKKLIALTVVLVLLLSLAAPAAASDAPKPQEIETTYTKAIGLMLGVSSLSDWFGSPLMAHTLAVALYMDLSEQLTEEEGIAFDIANGYIRVKGDTVGLFVPETGTNNIYMLAYSYQRQIAKYMKKDVGEYRKLVMQMLASDDAEWWTALDASTLALAIAGINPDLYK